MSPALTSAQAERPDEVARLLANYRPLPGVFDEMADAAGSVRPHWQAFLSRLADLGIEETGRRFADADRHLRESGVFYRVYEDTGDSERAWPLSHVPLLIDAADWRALETGLIQRANLLEAILRDAYGPASLVRNGRLPAGLIAGNPEFLRPMVGATPRGGAHLRLYAADIGRAADGRWWVLSDRAQAPSGSGYALENRLALVRALPDLYRASRVARLAPYFQALQADLTGLGDEAGSRACLLTPGPLNETYFEHAFLARYLGFLLVEGADLTVRDDGLFLRTVIGLRRVEALMRRLDSDFADPLELNARSHLGVPGLVRAARDGQVAVVNALGSGLIEARALLAFLPALARDVLGEDLILPNIATWWLGDPAVREQVLSGLDARVIASAFSDNGAGEAVGEGVLAASLHPARRERLRQAIEDRGVDFVAQEAVTLSTMPVWRDGHLEPRPFILRVFLTRSGEGWQVMPGGFVRVADATDARAVTLQHGGRTADAWVLSDRPVGDTTLLPTPERMAIRRSTGMLPSRTAENLFWVGRYVERAEATLRVVRALLYRASARDDGEAAVAAQLSGLLTAWNAVPEDLLDDRPAFVARAALLHEECPGALPQLARSARFSSSVIRDRLAPDAWRAIMALNETLHALLPAGTAESAMLDRVTLALRILSSFSGLAQENMTQLGGWRFLEIGRRIERAIATCRFITTFATDNPPPDALDALLELCDSQITYRARYVMVAARAPVVDLVALDPNNPRAIVYQIERIEEHLHALRRRFDRGPPTPLQHLAEGIAARLHRADGANVGSALIGDVDRTMQRLSDLVTATHLSHRAEFDSSVDADAGSLV